MRILEIQLPQHAAGRSRIDLSGLRQLRHHGRQPGQHPVHREEVAVERALDHAGDALHRLGRGATCALPQAFQQPGGPGRQRQQQQQQRQADCEAEGACLHG
ncbi:hypothetical protein [Siccirubricoccus sp. G192]|uniref:hypothetical protein n=1 Tax=Siccirubricoccus sp. G192 TaxID=2849651 RepID=UPI001C2CAA18|nr:hypothetical protein [Siccirubricoccus sp. G192]MBV1799961.1 hypothetical protein [Siccirubricoccus sp. G192]